MTELSGCKFLKVVCFMQLLISNTISAASNYRLEGGIIKLPFNTIWFCWRKLNLRAHLEETGVGW